MTLPTRNDLSGLGRRQLQPGNMCTVLLFRAGQVTDACTSSGALEDIEDGDPFEFENEGGDYDGQPESPGECDVIVKVRAACIGPPPCALSTLATTAITINHITMSAGILHHWL
jgi:hypothetical protein